MPPKGPESSPADWSRSKSSRSRAIRRLVIWYRRNAAVTTLVDSATSSASAAGNVAGTMVSGAGTVASSVLQPLVFDPLRRLQGGSIDTIEERDRLWVAVDGMGGDHAPGSILEGCLQAIERLPLKIKFIGEHDRVLAAARTLQLSEVSQRIARDLAREAEAQAVTDWVTAAMARYEVRRS